MAFNQVSDKQYETIMVRDGHPQLEEWRELKELIPILDSKIVVAKQELERVMLEAGHAKHKKMKIEEKVYLANKDVL